MSFPIYYVICVIDFGFKFSFKVHYVKIQFPDVEHCYPAGLDSLVPIQLLYPPLFSLSGACSQWRITESLEALRKFAFWAPITPFSLDIYVKPPPPQLSGAHSSRPNPPQ